MVSVIEVVNLSKSFRGKSVLSGVSFCVERGEVFGVIGMSGSGKTTLLNTLIGFLVPSGGDVFYRPDDVVDGELRNVSRWGFNVKQSFGFAPQRSSFYQKLSVEENLYYFGRLYKLRRDVLKKNVNYLLRLTHLEKHKDKLADQLSGGMQRRLSISCALVHSPSVLILDEPTADLDPVLREETWDLIRGVNKKGTTVIVASHFLDELEAICDRVAIVDNGRILKTGSLADIKQGFAKGNTEVIFRLKERNDKLVNQLRKGQSVVVKGRKVVIRTKDPKQVLLRLAREMKSHGSTVASVEVHPASLREVFTYLAKKRR